MPANFFENKIVWITGASSGIGEALVYAFSKQGAKLIISSRKEKELQQVKQNSLHPENIFTLPLDLSQPQELETKTQQALQQWGGLHYMIHNAGIAARDLVENTSEAVYRSVMETNFFGPVAITKAILPTLLEKGSGHIVVVSSLSGKYGVPKLSAYAASKHALHGFFDSLRAEVTKKGIRISIVIPGFINTPIINHSLNGSGVISGKNMSVNEKGMSAEACAAKILKAIRHQKQEALIGNKEMLSVYLNRFFPKLFSRIIRNNPVQRMQALFSKKGPKNTTP